jgi:hypothetical protein
MLKLFASGLLALIAAALPSLADAGTISIVGAEPDAPFGPQFNFPAVFSAPAGPFSLNLPVVQWGAPFMIEPLPGATLPIIVPIEISVLLTDQTDPNLIQSMDTAYYWNATADNYQGVTVTTEMSGSGFDFPAGHQILVWVDGRIDFTGQGTQWTTLNLNDDWAFYLGTVTYDAPEPAGWALLIPGLAMLGTALWRVRCG